MVGELKPVPVDPLRADRAFWTRYHVLRRTRHSELRPDDPLEPDEVTEARMKKPNPFDEDHYFEISRDGSMVSWFTASNATPRNPEYETNKHLLWGDLFVMPDHRRQRVATSWLPTIVQLMKEHGATVLGMTASHDEAHAFLKSLGATAKLAEVESRLKLAEVDWEMMQRWVDEGRRRSPDTRLEIYDRRLPEELLEKFSEERTKLLNTMPFENLDIGDIIVTPERIHDEYDRMEATGEVNHDVITWEPDGSISAMTDVTWGPYRRTLIEQQFTGVRPDARGRGLGKWIKAAMLLHIRELYPDAEWIATGNAGSNAPMLKINRAMGFKPYREHVDYQVTRDVLEERIRTA
jgi:GNAT superfamily N-acetyltransferase